MKRAKRERESKKEKEVKVEKQLSAFIGLLKICLASLLNSPSHHEQFSFLRSQTVARTQQMHGPDFAVHRTVGSSEPDNLHMMKISH